MVNFNRGDRKFGGDNRDRGGSSFGGRDGGRPSFPKKSWDGPRAGGDRERSEMFKATCSNCGKPCEVPFRPVNGKPVYCKDCFGSRDVPKQARFERPEAPRGDMKPRFENNNNQNHGAPNNGGNEELKKQMQTMNVKLDRLIQAIESLSTSKQAPAKEAVKAAPMKEVAKPAPVATKTKKETAKAPAKKVANKKKPIKK